LCGFGFGSGLGIAVAAAAAAASGVGVVGVGVVGVGVGVVVVVVVLVVALLCVGCLVGRLLLLGSFAHWTLGHLSRLRPMMSKVLVAYEKETGSTPDIVEEEAPLDVQTLLAADNVHLSLPESLIKAAEESPDGKDFEGPAAVEAGVRAAQRRVQGQIQFVVDCDEGLADLLRETKAAQMNGDPEAKSYVAVVFDGKVACESGSQAKYRLPPLRQPQFKRLVGAYLALRDGELAEGDIFVMLDGGKGPTFEDSVTKVVGKKLQASKTTVVYTFESCEARLERASKQTLDMVETVSMLTHDGFSAKATRLQQTWPGSAPLVVRYDLLPSNIYEAIKQGIYKTHLLPHISDLSTICVFIYIYVYYRYIFIGINLFASYTYVSKPFVLNVLFDIHKCVYGSVNIYRIYGSSCVAPIW